MNRIVLFSIFTLVFSISVDAQQIREIKIDVKHEKGTQNTLYKKCVGAGRANEGLRADWQEQFKIIIKECGFEYIRFHGIFHDDMGVYRETEEGDATYNWQYVDKLYDFILSANAKPFVEMSFMPKGLASGDKTVFWWKGNVTPPKSMDKYKSLVYEFVKHLTERYGEEEVKSWYFEVWNEPDHPAFFTGTQSDYFEMYKNAALAVKSISKNYRIGGPATAGSGWVNAFLDFCFSKEVPIDFVSSHGYNVNGFLDEFGKKQLKLSKNPRQVIENVSRVSDKIAKHTLKDLELHFTEWSSSYSPADPVHDTYQNATFVLNTLKNVEGKTTSMSYWTFTDIFEESDVPTTPFHGGFGLLNLQGIRKPTFFAYKYLNQLGEIELVNSDKRSWASKQGKNIQLLIYDFTYLEQGDLFNSEFYRMNHKPATASIADVNLENMENGDYQLVVYKTGYLNNDVFTHYYNMGLPRGLTKKQVVYLKKSTADQPVLNKTISIKNGFYSTSFDLQENDILFITLNKL